MATSDLVQLLHDKAPTANAVAVTVSDMTKALEYVADICDKKTPCVLLMDDPKAEQGSPDQESGLPTRVRRVLAAPDLPTKSFNAFKKICDQRGWDLLRADLRDYASGIDIGIITAAHAVAESATCIIKTNSEEILLAGAVCEICIVLVHKADLLENLHAAAPFVREFMTGSTDGTYTSFITGPSRTGDIEQVLTLGAHGPIELHIIVLEG